jgi:hypothetical protein
MKLKRLEITRDYWLDEDSPLKGSIEFMDNKGEIKLLLDEEQCHRMLAIAADALVAQSKTIASDLTANVINARALLDQK